MTGEDLKDVRVRMGLTQAALGSLLGIAAQTVSHMEHDRKVITQAIEKSLIAHYKLWQIKKVLEIP